jgi:hypothetical protein
LKPSSDERGYWLDKPSTIKGICWTLYTVCAALFLVDPLLHRHAHFRIEGWLGFYAWYGWIGCVFLVLAAKQLRRVLMRDESYYDR